MVTPRDGAAAPKPHAPEPARRIAGNSPGDVYSLSSSGAFYSERRLNVLVACECSGRVREAFRALGHDAWSCDLQEAEDASPYHIRGDVRPHLRGNWDLIIAHPPCDYLANCGARWRAERGEWPEIAAGAAFFMECLEAPTCPVAVENPVMNRKQSGIRKANFSVQPWMFGDLEAKRTCFWTKGLPPLRPEITVKPEGVKASVHREPPGPDRKRNRSRTFPGIARAMAEQWSAYLLGQFALEAEQ